jgi:pimeloyl-ACP methyl ester carboxylesterase
LHNVDISVGAKRKKSISGEIMSLFKDVFYQTTDGLRLHARDYDQAPGGKIPVLCLPGLTRNARDFDGVAARLAPAYRVIVAEQRGRGQSAYDPKPENYQPMVYVQDMITLLDHLAVPKVAIIGTSLGGLMAMIIGAHWPERIAGILFNDIGPEVVPAGIEAIKSYIDGIPGVVDWDGAALAVKLIYGAAFPNYNDDDWHRMARNSYRENADGSVVPDRDMAIAINVKKNPSNAIDLWPMFDALPKVPLAVVRGCLSNLFSAEIQAKMAEHRPDLMVAELAHEGHAPTLEEPGSVALIDRFLSAI